MCIGIMKITYLKPTVRALSALAVVCVATGCAMKGDIRLLQEELRAVSARQDSLMAEIREQTLSTQDTLRNQGDAMFDLRGDVNRQLRDIAQSQQRLEAMVGENQRGLSAIRDQLANMRRAPGGSVGSVGGSGGGESLLGDGGTADQLWTTASDLMTQGSLRSATQAFQDFITQFPDHPQVPRAHYLLADILVEQGRPEDALNAFQQIQSLFPTHQIVPEAMYRIAQIQVEEGNVDDAKATLERILNTYPQSLVASMAGEMLDEIG